MKAIKSKSLKIILTHYNHYYHPENDNYNDLNNLEIFVTNEYEDYSEIILKDLTPKSLMKAVATTLEGPLQKTQKLEFAKLTSDTIIYFVKERGKIIDILGEVYKLNL